MCRKDNHSEICEPAPRLVSLPNAQRRPMRGIDETLASGWQHGLATEEKAVSPSTRACCSAVSPSSCWPRRLRPAMRRQMVLGSVTRAPSGAVAARAGAPGERARLGPTPAQCAARRNSRPSPPSGTLTSTRAPAIPPAGAARGPRRRRRGGAHAHTHYAPAAPGRHRRCVCSDGACRRRSASFLLWQGLPAAGERRERKRMPSLSSHPGLMQGDGEGGRCPAPQGRLDG